MADVAVRIEIIGVLLVNAGLGAADISLESAHDVPGDETLGWWCSFSRFAGLQFTGQLRLFRFPPQELRKAAPKLTRLLAGLAKHAGGDPLQDSPAVAKVKLRLPGHTLVNRLPPADMPIKLTRRPRGSIRVRCSSGQHGGARATAPRVKASTTKGSPMRKTERAAVFSEPLISERLIALARKGDPAALNELLRILRPHLRTWANQMNQGRLGRREDASDLVQQALVKVWQSAPSQFDGVSEDEMLAWVQQILQNGHIDVLRRHLAKKRSLSREMDLGFGANAGSAGQSPPDHGQDDPSTPSRAAVRREDAERIRAALVKLPERQAEAVRLYYIEERSIEDVRQQMGLATPDAVSQLIRRGLIKLRGLLAQSDE